MKLRSESNSEDRIRHIVSDPLSDSFCCLTLSGNLVFLNASTLSVRYNVTTSCAGIRGLKISADGQHLMIVSLDHNGFLRREDGVFSAENCKRWSRYSAATFDPDSKVVLAAADDVLEFIHIKDFYDYFLEEPTGDRCAGIAFHPQGDVIAVSACWQGGSAVRCLKMFVDDYVYDHVENFADTIIFEYDELTEPSFSPDGNLLSVGHHIPVIYSLQGTPQPKFAFDQTGRQVDPFPTPDIVRFTRLWTRQIFHPTDGTYMAGSPDGQVIRIDVRDGSLISIVQAHEGGVWDICLSPNHQELVSCGADGCVRVWRL